MESGEGGEDAEGGEGGENQISIYSSTILYPIPVGHAACRYRVKFTY